MHQGLDQVMQECHRAGNNPPKMDLAGLRQNLGDQFDIYIINEYGAIEYTTYQLELGVDFKTVPYFYDYLNQIRNSEGFFPRPYREGRTWQRRAPQIRLPADARSSVHP